MQDVLIDGKSANAYWQLYMDKAGAIHLSWVWRETWMVKKQIMTFVMHILPMREKTWYKSTGEKNIRTYLG